MNKSIPQRKTISHALIRLRKERALTQAGLAKMLRISQQRLSEIERTKGSLSAEQLIYLLQHFNLPLSYFAKIKKASLGDQLQNALARLGAFHLREVSHVYVPEKWEEPDEVILEVLWVSSSNRLLLALVPVLVINIRRIHLSFIESKLASRQIANRLYWLCEGTVQGIRRRRADVRHRFINPILKKNYGMALDVLQRFCFSKKEIVDSDDNEDILDLNLISEKSVAAAKKQRDTLAKKWRILTNITEKDFEKALIEIEKR